MKNPVPTYDLYGEKTANAQDFWLHCETIPSRSSLHQWEIRLHRHDNLFQLLYVASGSSDALFGDQIVRIEPPAIVTVPPSMNHGFRFSSDIDGFVFTVLASHLRVAPGERRGIGQFLAEPKVTRLDQQNSDARFVGEIISRLGTEWLTQRGGRTDLMEAYLTTTLTLTARLSSETSDEPLPDNTNERRIEHLTALLHQHVRYHRPASFYAQALGISPTHLNRVVRTVTGLSAHDFINRKLLNEIKRELVFTVASAQDVGFRLGFADPAYFSRFFVKHTGSTPRTWREQERKRLAVQPSE